MQASESVVQHPQQAATAVLALLTGGAPKPEEISGQRWWQASGSSSDFDAALDALVRGACPA